MDNKQILEALDDIVTFREEPTPEQIEALIEAMDIVEKYSKIGGSDAALLRITWYK